MYTGQLVPSLKKLERPTTVTDLLRMRGYAYGFELNSIPIQSRSKEDDVTVVIDKQGNKWVFNTTDMRYYLK